ncbi:MAG: dicarboxylate/amino acid:cation symporter [Bacteroidaceae bacterium]|nr:dicarboxylate/amino acid:cation symporter [Candidatus Minthousia equi]MCQ2246188.1 dicarboxylate/amino acid:cation symporter [Bacteroidaceae bacterium]MDO4955589.1 dicarboxylate/amino acid:cation symporter [Bacteroidales bacterium]
MKITKLPLLVRIIIAITLGIALGFVMPDVMVRVFNTFNGVFDQLLKFLIPLIIIGLVTSAIADVGKGAGRMLLITAGIAYGATVLSGLFSYVCSITLFPALVASGQEIATNEAGQMFPAFFTIEIPPLMPVMTSLISSFLLGLGIASFGAKVLKQGFDELKDIVTLAISKVIIPLLPIYIFGLFLDMTASGQVGPVLTAFIGIIVVIFSLTAVLLLLQYSIAGAITKRNPLKLLVTMMPAYFTALGTSSSAATIPVTMQQTLKNGVRENVAGFVVPLCATIHLSGSTLKIVACAIAIMLIQHIPFDFPLMLGFILMLGITMVAAPGVPGGAIMAALGILDSILEFNAEQQAMMITLYIAMDSFGTACNVTGDGAIALIINKLKK